MTGRIADRIKHRAPCTLTLDGRRHNAFALDLSRSGLFIQTSAKPEPGTRLDIELVLGGQRLLMHVEVARRKQVPPQLLTVAHGGLGVRILSAPEEFYQLLAESQGGRFGLQGAGSGSTGATLKPRSAPDTARAAGSARKPTSKSKPEIHLKEYSVRVKQVNGTRTRMLRVQGADEVAARREIAEDLGEGWKILEISPL